MINLSDITSGLTMEEADKLSPEQIETLFDCLDIPLERIAEGSPILITCPFIEEHSKDDGEKDCRLYFDVFPHIDCFHNSCEDSLKHLNLHLRIEILGSPAIPVNFFPERTPSNWKLAKEVEKKRPDIIARYLPHIRPLEKINMLRSDAVYLLLKGVTGVIWMGRTEKDSGSQEFAQHFQTLDTWIEFGIPGDFSYISGCTFKPGSISRCAENVVVWKYLILESDTLTRDECRAMFEWVENELGLKLVAIVYSGHESHHGWFVLPDEKWLERNKEALLAAGFCSGPLNKSQPVRLPNGVNLKTGKTQDLLWLDPDLR